MTLIIGGVIIVLILYFSFFLSPTLDSIEKTRKGIRSAEKNMTEFKRLLEKYKKTESKPDKNKFKGSLSAFVEKTAKDIDVTVSYIRPYGKKNEGVEVKFDEMPSDKIVKFIYEMETKGILVSRLNMRDYKGTGDWVVRINLEM